MLAKCLTLALLSIQFTVGQECRVTGDKTNSLKCADQVYTRGEYFLEDFEACNPGEIGTLYTQSWVKNLFSFSIQKSGRQDDSVGSCGRRPKDPPIFKCILTRHGWENGRTFGEPDGSLGYDFGQWGKMDHYEPILQLFDSCWKTGRDDPPESTEVVQCLSKGYEKICGYKTCNWLNNFE